MSTQEREPDQGQWTPAYRAYCPSCRKSGREFRSYGNAEEAARGHADKHNHQAHVIDQYGIRVIGSGQRPGEADP